MRKYYLQQLDLAKADPTTRWSKSRIKLANLVASHTWYGKFSEERINVDLSSELHRVYVT
jgi:hypothetical protein